LIASFKAGYVPANKDHDADALISAITENQAIPVIPAKKNRKVPSIVGTIVQRRVMCKD
jgi:hypothetical protein